MNPTSHRQWVENIAWILTLYPLSLFLLLLVDTFLGEAEFIQYFIYESKRQAVLYFLHDWLFSLPFSAILWFLSRLIISRAGYIRTIYLFGLSALIAFIFTATGAFVPTLVSTSLAASAILIFIFHTRIKKT